MPIEGCPVVGGFPVAGVGDSVTVVDAGQKVDFFIRMTKCQDLHVPVPVGAR
jgi:hypothetical protein